MRAAVVGHVERVWFAAVDRFPRAGEIVHAAQTWEEAAGGGGVAAVQLARMGAEVDFFTALGDDEHGREAERELTEWGVRVHAAKRTAPQRRAFTLLDSDAERTIVVIGERHVPRGEDPLPWDALERAAGAYFTGGDAGALAAARRAGVLVATTRARGPLTGAGVPLDALVFSADDPSEAYAPGDVDPPPALVVSTGGGQGGRWEAAEGRTGTWEAAPPPRPPIDAYGCGDTFAAALTGALARGDELDAALAFAARAGAACLAGRGPFGAALESL
ncbi:MAG: ribokinase [Solirubrobacteraceae bacterium]|jgi:ribokinase|nr:ribokinase [Solirubrobacteraceae bacterium]